MRRLVSCFAFTMLITLLLVQTTQAGRRRVAENGPAVSSSSTSVHTITGWCLDLSDMLHVNVPVIVGRAMLQPPLPGCTPSPYPVTVPNGSRFVAGGVFIWFTNRSYPPMLRDALAENGYHFASNSPQEDFMAKLDQVKVEILTYPAYETVATYNFDPRQNFRLMQFRTLFEPFAWGLPDAVNDPSLDIHISSEEFSRLPMFNFPGEVGPVPPGTYVARVWWHLTDLHNDGTGLQDGNFFPEGWNLYGGNLFVVAP